MKNQSGRSMIEMLGVLAIIGVLSLGGVATFNAAMNRHTANNLTYDVMLMAESTVSLGPQEQMPFDASTKYDQMSSVLVAGVANVIVNDVDEEICDILISKGGNGVFVLEKQADGSPLTDCDDDGTDIVFAFRDGYLPEAGVCNPACDPDHICSNGECCLTHIPEHACSIEPTEACAGVTPSAKRDGAPCGDNGDGFCDGGRCIVECRLSEKICAGQNKEFDQENCICRCPGNWSGENCDQCNLIAEQCEGNGKNVDQEHCLCICEAEGLTGYYCSYSCPLSTTSVSGLSKSACEACGNTFWYEGDCLGCEYYGRPSFDTEAEAEACENACAGTEYKRVAVGTYCELATEGCPLATSRKYWMTKSDCEECGNAFWKDGYCYGCGYSDWISFPTEEEAGACASACADSGYERTADGNYCYRSPSTQCPTAERIPNMTKSVCEACVGAVWSDGDCYDCGYLSPLSFATEEEAEACVSACAGVYERVAVGTECYFAETMCPWETEVNPIMTKSTCEGCFGTVWSDGHCYFCGYSGSISFDTELEAEACVSACASSGYERIAVETYCYLATNPPDCPSATSAKSGRSKSTCETCKNTFWRNGVCWGCGYSDSISFDTEAEAETCENACAGTEYKRVAVGKNCYRATEGCPSAGSFKSKMFKSDCDKCGNTVWDNGYCYDCGSEDPISFDTELEAEACVSACADSGYERTADGNYCYRSPSAECPGETESTSNMTKSVCEGCDNTFWQNGSCVGCGYSSEFSIPFPFHTEEEAEACVAACADSRYPREVDKSGNVYYCSRK